ncbi:MAG: hypothetical protein IPH75_08690 [bacterium]|nr:hypothetical protein [bacterium]
MKKSLIVIALLAALGIVSGFAADKPPVSQVMQLGSVQIPYPIRPAFIDYPEYTKPCIEKQYTVTIINRDDLMFEVVAITVHEDSARPSAPDGWLDVSGTISEVPPHESLSVTLRLNAGGIVCNPYPTVLYGRLVFTVTQLGNTGDGVVEIRFTVADTIVLPQWDTVTTQCGIPLTIATNGNLGGDGIGGANLNFPQPVPECDTGENNPGNAALYLYSGSPVILRNNGDVMGASWNIYDEDITSPHGFKPLFPSSNRGYFSAARWQGYNTGTFCTSDSLVKLERTVWAPYGATNADSCRFMIIRTRYWPYTINQSVSNLAIGDAFDWDIPSDSGDFLNVAFTDPTRRLVGMRGFDAADTGAVCYPNSLRYGGAALLEMHLKTYIAETNLYAGYNARNDSFVYPQGTFIPEQLWENMQSTGYSNEVQVSDLHSVLVYKNGAANQGWTLPANDTLTVYTAVAVVRPTGGTVTQGLDSLKREIDKASIWYRNVRTWAWPCGCCCIGMRGNVNASTTETPDLSDLSLMIAHLTSDPRPALPNFAEADVNADCKIDLADLSCLIDKLTNPTSTCIRQC